MDIADVQHVNARLACLIAGVDHARPVRRKARCQNDRARACQILKVRTVVVHDRKTLGALILGAAFRDEDDAAVEIARFARDAGIDLIGNFVGHAAHAIGGADKLHPLPDFRTREHVIDAEFHHQLAIGIHIRRTCDQHLRVDRLPVGELHGALETGDLADVRLARDFTEKPCACQVRRHNLAQFLREILGRGAFRNKGGGRKGHRFDHTFGDFDPQRLGRSGRRLKQQTNGHDSRPQSAELENVTET